MKTHKNVILFPTAILFLQIVYSHHLSSTTSLTTASSLSSETTNSNNNSDKNVASETTPSHLSSSSFDSVSGTTPMTVSTETTLLPTAIITTATSSINSNGSSLTTTGSRTSLVVVETPPETTTENSNNSSTTTTVNRTTKRPALKDKTNCDEQLIYVDSCIKRIVLIGDREAVIPKTVQELEENHCNRIHGELLCVRDYGKSCLKLFPRTIFTLVRKNVERVYRNFCHTKEGKEMAIKHFSCFKPQNLPVLHSVVDRITLTLEYIAKNVTDDNQILPYMCCAFYTFYQQTQIIVDGLCLNTTGPDTSQFVINLIKAVVTDALDLGCGKFGSYKKCQENLPQGIQVFNSIFTQDSSSHHSHADNSETSVMVSQPNYSPVIPMIAISKRLDSGLRRRR